MAGEKNLTTNRITGWFKIVSKDFRINKSIYLLFLPVLVFYMIFRYIPMNGVIMAFQNYSPGAGIIKSKFVGLNNFIMFFNNPMFGRLITNTILLSLYGLLWGFPAPILLAILLNEVKSAIYKKTIQTITYVPHFISMTVIAGIVRILVKRDGIINYILGLLGIKAINFLMMPSWFRTIYITSDIWVGMGFGTIIYLAAIASLGTEIYEAARIDGAGRLKQAIHLTLPGILPVISLQLIFAMSGLLNVGAGKILLLYNPAIYETSDVISTYIYRNGIIDGRYSLSAAIGLFNSVVNLILLVTVNRMARVISEYSLW